MEQTVGQIKGKKAAKQAENGTYFCKYQDVTIVFCRENNNH
ncbi:hypothetical protein P7G97_08830 [Enterococcus canintestini]|nr:hypothetical protein [Enterococcus canintestini]